jgi:hypothetical protein
LILHGIWAWLGLANIFTFYLSKICSHFFANRDATSINGRNFESNFSAKLFELNLLPKNISASEFSCSRYVSQWKLIGKTFFLYEIFTHNCTNNKESQLTIHSIINTFHTHTTEPHAFHFRAFFVLLDNDTPNSNHPNTEIPNPIQQLCIL